ncbi:amino acid transporter [Apiospora saccharicola]|uniref:Amino acid transporter n=1 Tax=Apiospora saccharicola TaxID=335842 RepID=A0ABR1W2N9_9PEZI
MAEMTSMAPTSGGQYHWVSEFAPRRHQKFLSCMVGLRSCYSGWVSALGWQTALAVTAYTAAQQFEALIALKVPSYRIQGWHGTLLSIAVAVFAIIFNTALARKLPLFEVLVGVPNVMGFAAFLAVLWSMAPLQHDEIDDTRRKKAAWTEFQDNAGWGNMGLATLVGILGPSVTLIGADSACHLSEEVRDASWVLPRSMVVTAAINYTVGFVMTVTVMMTVGDHASELLDSWTGQVYVQILLDVTQSRAGTSVSTALIAVLLLFCAVIGVTTSSRQLFAFARDNGLPCSRWLTTVPVGWDIPINAVVTTLIITALLSLIIIGSSIAFNVITAIGQVGLYTFYIITLFAIIARREEQGVAAVEDVGAVGRDQVGREVDVVHEPDGNGDAADLGEFGIHGRVGRGLHVLQRVVPDMSYARRRHRRERVGHTVGIGADVGPERLDVREPLWAVGVTPRVMEVDDVVLRICVSGHLCLPSHVYESSTTGGNVYDLADNAIDSAAVSLMAKAP